MSERESLSNRGQLFALKDWYWVSTPHPTPQSPINVVWTNLLYSLFMVKFPVYLLLGSNMLWWCFYLKYWCWVLSIIVPVNCMDLFAAYPIHCMFTVVLLCGSIFVHGHLSTLKHLLGVPITITANLMNVPICCLGQFATEVKFAVWGQICCVVTFLHLNFGWGLHHHWCCWIIGYVSNETDTDVHMYTWRIYSSSNDHIAVQIWS